MSQSFTKDPANLTGTGTAGKVVQFATAQTLADGTNTDAEIAASVALTQAASDSPGAAAKLLKSTAAGLLTLVNMILSSLTASTVIYSNASKQITSLANAAGYLKNDGAGALSYDTPASGGDTWLKVQVFS